MRRFACLSFAFIALLIAGCAGLSSGPGREEQQALAPTGKLRVALYLGAPASIVRGATLDESKGVGFDLGKELARRIGVPFEPVVYPSPGAIMGGLKSGEWDVTFFGPNPEREAVLNFTTAFLVIEHGYLVPAGSSIATINAVDRPGIRIGAPQGGSVNAFLARTVKQAAVVGSPSVPAGADLLASGKVDVFAANKANLFELSDRLPGSRVLEGRIGVDEVRLHSPRAARPEWPICESTSRTRDPKGWSLGRLNEQDCAARLTSEPHRRSNSQTRAAAQLGRSAYAPIESLTGN